MKRPNPPIGTASERSLALLLQQHEHVEDECRALLGSVYVDEPRLLDTHWASLEAQLLDHMAAEEELILPGYARDVPDDARTIRAGHDALRTLIAELSLEARRHAITVETVERLIVTLHEHTEAEGSVMYAWAETNILEPRGSKLFQRMWRWLA